MTTRTTRTTRTWKQSMIQKYLYDNHNPEFTSTQQTTWTILLGVILGFMTAVWQKVLDLMICLIWRVIPKWLLKWGVFTELDGYMPLPHYMWICPALLTGILSYITESYKQKNKAIPDQNEWIMAIHRVAVLPPQTTPTMLPIFILSTIAMSSGLSLAPEVPLFLLSNAFASYISLNTNQSVLSTRVLHIVSSSAAIGGFFGFPLGSAFFVLEIPHRMGMQYFEALASALIGSTVSVFVNRKCSSWLLLDSWGPTSNGGVLSSIQAGMNFDSYVTSSSATTTSWTTSLPKHILLIAIICGVVGSFIGHIYTMGTLFSKELVEERFNDNLNTCVANSMEEHSDDEEDEEDNDEEEQHRNLQPTQPLVPKEKTRRRIQNSSSWTMAGRSFGVSINYPVRAAIRGLIIGGIVGLIGMFLPHELFWGQAQLQTLIDRGQTPLPVFDYKGEISILTHYGYCMTQEEDGTTLSTACVGMIGITKIIITGLSLGTGICGGHFFSPLFVGCALSHLLTDTMSSLVHNEHGFIFQGFFEEFLMVIPIVLLCIMGSTHHTVFRCYVAIVILLSLSLMPYSVGGEDEKNPLSFLSLLVVACLIPFMTGRETIFYKSQASRVDVLAIPEVLCQPAFTSGTAVCDVEESDDSDDDDDDDDCYQSDDSVFLLRNTSYDVSVS